MAIYTTGAKYVQRGFGQVEPNHLTAGYTGHVYSQLPANKDIDILENGQYVKYDQSKKEVNFDTTPASGGWMMVYNELQLYRDYMTTADWAMIKDNYIAQVYSPIEQPDPSTRTALDYTGTASRVGYGNDLGDPYQKTLLALKEVGMMPTGTNMVPRVIKVELGDWYTTNCVNEDTLAVGDTLKIGDKGYLVKGTTDGGDLDPMFVVDKVYTLADMQRAVKIRRIA